MAAAKKAKKKPVKASKKAAKAKPQKATKKAAKKAAKKVGKAAPKKLAKKPVKAAPKKAAKMAPKAAPKKAAKKLAKPAPKKIAAKKPTKKAPAVKASNGPWNGRFVWHDLMTKDGAKAQAFYSALFGWEVQEIPMQGCTYRMIHAGPGPIGGIVEDANIPMAHWMPYLATADVDQAAAKCAQLGGSMCVPPTDLPGTGRFAVVGDPQGAYFSLYKGLPETQGADPDQPVLGRVCWNELLTTDDAAAQSFYSAMFGWNDEPKDMGPIGIYHIQTLQGQQAAGIMKNPQNGAPSSWLAYFLVADLAKATAKAKSLGATAMMENAPIPDVGAFSLLSDPTGAVFALFQTK
jgi:predicted enzyme related to lactoylglutathione lyase